MSDVFFFDYQGSSSSTTDYGEIGRLLDKLPLDEVVSPGDSVAVKAHMGELGNTTYTRPGIVKRAVEMVKAAGGSPFVTDTTTLYPRERWTAAKYLQTAAKNGFSPESMGAPIVIADGELGYDGARRPVGRRADGCDLDEVEVARSIAEADAMVVISHAKGHSFTGIGGAIKNVGMGCITKNTKAAIHRPNRPEMVPDNCAGCGKCLERCAYGALRIDGGKARMDGGRCVSCASCYYACPNKAMKIPDGATGRVQVYLAHGAAGALEKFRGKACFVNVVQDVTPLCDCVAKAGNPIVADAGVLASLDPVAIDKASLDLIDRAELVPGALADDGPDRLGRLHRVDSTVQMRTAAKLGLGELEYRLVKINP